MKRIGSISVLTAICLFTTLANPQTASAADAELGKGVLKFFVGDWEVESVSQSGTTTGSRHIEWLFEGQSVISRATSGSTETCVIFAWDPISKTVTEWGFSNSGAHWKIAWKVKPDGEHFSLQGDLSGFTPDGQKMARKGVTVKVENAERFVVNLPAGKVGDGAAPPSTLTVSKKR